MPVDPTPMAEMFEDIAAAYSISKEEAAERIHRALSGDATPVQFTGPPCLRCGGDLADHILAAGPNGGDDEYRCLVDELSDVIADLETSDPPAEPGWVEVLRHVETAYKRSLVSVEGPIVVDRAQHMADMATITEQVADEGGPLGTPTAFAVLRDIADAEPVAPIIHPTDRLPDVGQLIESTLKYALRCTMCKAVGASTAPTAREPFPPVTHLISCPWARTVQIVGVNTDG
jgi:hypothetical protein